MRGLFRALHAGRYRFPPAIPLGRLVLQSVSGHERSGSAGLRLVPFIRRFSSPVQQQLSWDNCSSLSEILLAKLETAINDHDPGVAWGTFCDYKRLYGYPRKFVVSRLVGMLSYASERRWCHRAYELVLSIIDEKGELPYDNSLARLSMTLARAQVPVPASTILRVLLEKDEFLSMDICKLVLLHMVKTEIGSCLAANVLFEVCECFLRNCADGKKSNRSKLMKPDTTLFNIVLSSCVQFGSVLKAQQIIDLMRRVGVLADANTINIIACVYEMSGQRGNLMNLEEHVCSVSSLSLYHYKRFYDSLLSLQFKFNDIDAASSTMLDMYKNSNSLDSSGISTLKNKELEKAREVQVGSSNLKVGYKIFAKPEQLPCDFVFQSLNSSGLVIIKDGKLFPSSKALSKLINGYVREKRVGDLSNLLASIHKEMSSSNESDVCSEVMDACIQLGWLETAHDILENLESDKVPVNFSTYKSLFNAYCTQNRFKEARVLLKQMKKTDFPISGEEAQAMSLCRVKETSIVHTEPANIDKKSQLVEFLEKEMGEDTQACQLVYELNSSIFFFCNAKMMEDAMRTLRKMQQSNVQATVQSFVHLVNGYSSLEMYRETTTLWGEIKRRMEDGILTPNRDLLDCLLWNFIRGGYFERVMEVIHCMNKHNIYVDRWMYKREFLKFHRSLYRNLKSSDASTDAQKKRLEHVQAFRRWARIGVKSCQNF